jgi:hypothetical protein
LDTAGVRLAAVTPIVKDVPVSFVRECESHLAASLFERMGQGASEVQRLPEVTDARQAVFQATRTIVYSFPGYFLQYDVFSFSCTFPASCTFPGKKIQP